MEKRLYIVSKRVPAGKRERKDRIWRFAVIASSDEDAITIVREEEDAYDAHAIKRGEHGGPSAYSAYESKSGKWSLGLYVVDKEEG